MVVANCRPFFSCPNFVSRAWRPATKGCFTYNLFVDGPGRAFKVFEDRGKVRSETQREIPNCEIRSVVRWRPVFERKSP